MKSFAFNFRASADGNRQSSTFSFEPENIYEKKCGNLYLIGHLTNSLPQDESFLGDLALRIKNAHYGSEHKTVEKSLNDCLQDANLYLKNLIKDGRTSWMGNLNFAVFALRNRDFFFAKTGAISILLLRNGEIVDLDQDLKDSPAVDGSQVFGNLVSGKLLDGDAILASTADISTFIKKQKIIKEIAQIASAQNQNFDAPRLERAFEAHKIRLANLEGSCLLISLRADILESTAREFRSDDSITKVSLREMFSSKRSAVAPPKLPKVSFGKNRGFAWAKTGVVVAVLAVVIAGGSLAYSIHRAQVIDNVKKQIQALDGRASSIANVKSGGQSQQDRDNLNSIVSELETIKNSANGYLPQISDQIAGAQARIDSAMMSINGAQAVDPTVIYQFTGFSPKMMVPGNNGVLAFDPGSNGIYSISGGESKYIDFAGGFDLAAESTGSVIFFIKPDTVIEYKNGIFLAPVKISLPYPNASYDDLGIYAENLYFVDRAAGNLIKYLRVGKGYSMPQSWLAGGSKVSTGEISLAFDRNAWVLSANGSIDKYFAGALETNIKPAYMPAPQNVTKIVTSSELQNLYVLDGAAGRVIIISKTGQLIKQLVSDRLKGALDLIISGSGKQILVLMPSQLLGISEY